MFPLSFGLALLLFIVQCCLAVALAAHATFWQMEIPGLGLNLLLLNFICLAINGYVLARTVKVRHFLGSFCQWPNLPEEISALAETRHLANAARQAYFHGDYDRVPNLLDRMPTPSVPAMLAKGRALAMGGDFDGAIPFLEQGGEGAIARRYLSLKPTFGLFSRRYFTLQDLRWTTRPLRLAILGMAALILSGSVLVLNYNAVLSALTRTAVDFSDKDFKVKTQGVFTFHYHDEAFMRQSAEIGEEALSQILLFLALPSDTFGPGQIHLFLCSDQKEYLARSPYTRSWEAGSAFPQKRQIYLYPLPENQHIYYDVILAHELTHLAYYRNA